MFAVLLGGSTVAIVSLTNAAGRLDKLALLHEVEILREDLIIRIEQVQSYISRNKIRSGGDVDALNARVQEMDQAMASCLGCHHSPERTQGLLAMRDVAGDYKQAISRLVAGSANPSQSAALERRSQNMGRDLIAMTRGMAFTANTGLHRRTQEAVRSLRSIRNVFFLTFALGLALAALTAAMLIKNVNRRLLETIEALRRVARGDLRHPMEAGASSGSGFQALGEAFNGMMNNLFLSRRCLEQDARIAGAAEMAVSVSSELDGQLAGILRDTDALLAAPGMTTEGKTLLIGMKRELLLFRDLVNRLKAFTPYRQLQCVKTDIAALVRNAIMQVQQEAKSGKIEIAFDCPADLPSVVVDIDQMKQVFFQLTRNAMRAMPDGGKLTIKCSQDKDPQDCDTVCIEYIDTGPGIAEDRRGDVFSPDVSVLTGGEKEDNGLALSYLAVRNHGGRIDVDSAPGRGAIFRVVLPI